MIIATIIRLISQLLGQGNQADDGEPARTSRRARRARRG
jgi:hypothetical protein